MRISKKTNALVSLVMMIILVTLFNSSMNWVDGRVTKHQLMVIAISIVGIVGVPLMVSFIEPCVKGFGSWIIFLKKILDYIKANIKIICRKAFVYITGVLISLLFELIVLARLNTGFNVARLLYIIGITWLIITIYLMRNIAFKKTEVLFAAVALILGTTFIVSSPIHVGVAWDDETHYGRVVSLSSFFDDVKYDADAQMIRDNAYFVYGYQDGSIDYNVLQNYYSNINNYYNRNNVNSTTLTYETEVGIYTIAYIPAAIMIIMAKGLRLPYIYIFMLGKLANLLVYVVVLYYAIKRLKTGKVLMSVFALSTTLLFQASSYSYDGWVVAWIMSGYSYFIAELQYKHRTMTRKNTFCMIMCFVFGAMPKAIYFVLMCPLLFMPKYKFKEKRDRIEYYILLLLGAFILAASFMVPRLLGGMGTGDTRGGSEVNAAAQLQYILSNPLEYVKIFFEFFINYISLNNCSGYLSYMAYLGDGKHAMILMTMMVVLSYLDRDEEVYRYPWIRLATYFGSFCAVGLAITAMYISFTPVGSNTVAGCQFRYLLPVIFPILYFIGVDGVKSKINKNVMTIVSISIASAIFILNFGTMYISSL